MIMPYPFSKIGPFFASFFGESTSTGREPDEIPGKLNPIAVICNSRRNYVRDFVGEVQKRTVWPLNQEGSNQLDRL
jgi:hypothetical protein